MSARQKTSIQWEVSNERGVSGEEVRGRTVSPRVQLNSSIHFKTKVAYESLRKKKKKERCKVQLTLMRWHTPTFTFFVVVSHCLLPFSPSTPSLLRQVTTCWDAGHYSTIFFLFITTVTCVVWLTGKEKKNGALIHLISNGKQDSGDFPTFGFPLRFTSRGLGNLYGFPRIFFFF